MITAEEALSLGTPAGKKKCAVSMTTPVIPHMATQILPARPVTTAAFFCWPDRSLPAGRLWAVRDPGQAHLTGSEQEISFTGWLGLLRALYEVTAEPGDAPHPGP